MTQRTCSIDGCEKFCHGHGLCKRHYARWERHGDPLFVTPRTGSNNPAWSDPPTYSTVHIRLRLQRGSATLRTCPCGAPAQQWAYDHTDPEPLTGRGMLYSPDLSRYVAMCVSCHVALDASYR